MPALDLHRSTDISNTSRHSRWMMRTISGLAVAAAAIFFQSSQVSIGAPPMAGIGSTATPTVPEGLPEGQAVAIFAGGCFWCTEAVFERMTGVIDVESGYIGGSQPNPTYEQVCTGRTGHAEAVRIIYDPSQATYDELLEVFFKTHDPTTLNRQGNDTGTQYRSSVFYLDDEQKTAAEKMIAKVDEERVYNQPIVTKLETDQTFYVAEEYHQDYFRLNPNAGYCQVVVANKVRKFNRSFGDKLKKELK